MVPLNPLSPLSSARPLSGSVGRAQNFSVSRLNYRKDIDNAKVSVNQLLNKKPNADNSLYAADADDKRYAYVQRLAMANRQKKEAAAQTSLYDTGIKTGGLYKTTGVLGLRRQLIRMRYNKPGTFKNVSSKDRQYFEDLTKKYLKGVSAGSGIGHHARRAMKQQMLRDRRAGKINVESVKDFSNMIDKLPKVRRGLL
jgi:hypothetical protein